MWIEQPPQKETNRLIFNFSTDAHFNDSPLGNLIRDACKQIDITQHNFYLRWSDWNLVGHYPFSFRNLQSINVVTVNIEPFNFVHLWWTRVKHTEERKKSQSILCRNQFLVRGFFSLSLDIINFGSNGIYQFQEFPISNPPFISISQTLRSLPHQYVANDTKKKAVRRPLKIKE